MLKEFFVGRLERIKKGLSAEKTDLCEAYIQLKILDSAKSHLEDSPELKEFQDDFSKLYWQVYIDIESKSQQISLKKRHGVD